MGMHAIGKAALALACVCAISACSNRYPTAADGTAGNPSPADDARAAAYLRAARSAGEFHASLAALDRIAGLMGAAADTTVFSPPLQALRGYGGGAVAHGPAAGHPTTLTALIKAAAPARPRRLGPAPHGAAALRKSSATDIPWGDDAVPDVTFEEDTAWFDYRDSARGQVHWIHLFRDPDWGVLSVVRDSLSYRWPAPDSTPALISATTSMRPFYGGEFRLVLNDDDGDGTLNSARPGATVRVRKEWRASSADTIRKSVWFLEHGAAMEGGGMGEGFPSTFADTLWIKGRVTGWTSVRDGDGDGLALEARAGGVATVKSEAFAALPDGKSLLTRIAARPGADGNWFAAADNAWITYGRTLLSAGGDTLSHWEGGDADGDGFYFDPNAPANLAWEAHRYPCGSGCLAYRDSVVKTLGDPDDASDDRVAFALARVRWDDGSESALRISPAEGAADFGSGGWAEAVETRVWPGAAGIGGTDSLSRRFRLEVGELADPSDDRIACATVRTWYGAGAVWPETEETRHGTALAVSVRLPGGRRIAGSYDAEAGIFADTLFRADGAREVRTGRYHRHDGSAEYAETRAGWPQASVRVERSEAGYTIIVDRPGSDARYAQAGMVTAWTQQDAEGPILHTATATADGGYALSLTALDRAGKGRAQGAFAFTAGGIGSGWIAARDGDGRMGFLSDADGDMLPDGNGAGVGRVAVESPPFGPL